MPPTLVSWARSASWRSVTACRAATASPPPTPASCRSPRTESFGTAATAKPPTPKCVWGSRVCTVYSSFPGRRVPVRGTVRLCVCVGEFRKQTVYFRETFPLFSFCLETRLAGEHFRERPPRRSAARSGSPDGLRWEDDGGKKEAGKSLYIKTPSCGRNKSLGIHKPLPSTPRTNH